MRKLFLLLAFIPMGGTAVAQDWTAMQAQVDSGINACATSGKIKTRVDAALCANDAMTTAYQTYHYPYMDLVYAMERDILAAAASFDAGKISQNEYSAKVNIAELDFNSSVAQRNQQSRANSDAAKNAELAQRRAAILGAYINGTGPFQRPPAPQPYYAPVPAPQTNCTTQVIGNQAYTHCQ